MLGFREDGHAVRWHGHRIDGKEVVPWRNGPGKGDLGRLEETSEPFVLRPTSNGIETEQTQSTKKHNHAYTPTMEDNGNHRVEADDRRRRGVAHTCHAGIGRH